MKCNGINCLHDASLICPTCKILDIKDLSKSSFCCQECFKTNFKIHKKQMHKLNDGLLKTRDMIASSGFYDTDIINNIQTYEQFNKLSTDFSNKITQRQNVIYLLIIIILSIYCYFIIY